jgi:hypothetical protein
MAKFRSLRLRRERAPLLSLERDMIFRDDVAM